MAKAVAKDTPKLMAWTQWLEAWKMRRFGEGNVMVHPRVMYDERGIMAKEFVDRWGMVAGIPDGEDSAGRSKLRLATPEELVDRAMACVEALYLAMDARGYRLDVPSFAEFKIDDDEGNH